MLAQRRIFSSCLSRLTTTPRQNWSSVRKPGKDWSLKMDILNIKPPPFSVPRVLMTLHKQFECGGYLRSTSNFTENNGMGQSFKF
ncbi:hypothetical protein AVEN_164231-1 [Araneus ventricosus]|uniref:Uncharacterized protein n=1 Tax=Araneus ventricosus TaxID=182803 RepID=A0A4Y2IDV9_ARAVE|nr:hypothetical protein AVEN_164231-1 [Araneus ventricosus]